MHIPVPGNWVVGRDRKGRGGFIRELAPNATCNDADKSIVFRLKVPAKDVRGRLSVNIVYQRSYWNAGFVEVFLCDNSIGGLDALWSDYNTFHFTIPEAVTMTGDGHCTGDGPAEIKIVHKFLNCAARGVLEQKPRLNQLFKILSISACYL